MRAFLYRIILVLVLASAYEALAQVVPSSLYAERVNAAIGLPKRTIFNLYISKRDHCLYIASQDAVYRWNGFKVQKLERDSDGDKGFTSIVELPDGSLYCRNFSNQLFKIERDKLRLLPLPYEVTKTQGSLEELGQWDGELFCYHSTGVFVYDPATQALKRWIWHAQQDDDLLGATFNEFTPSWFARSGLYVLEGEKVICYGRLGLIVKPFLPFVVQGGVYMLDRNAVPAKRQVLWFPQFRQPEQVIGIGDADVMTSGWLWGNLSINTDNGVFLVKPGTTKIVNHLFPQKITNSILQDGNGQLWIANYSEGLYRCPSNQVTHYEWPQGFNATAMCASPTRSKAASAAVIYAGSKSGQILAFDSAGRLVRKSGLVPGASMDQMVPANNGKPLIITQYQIMDTSLRDYVPTNWWFRSLAVSGNKAVLLHSNGFSSWTVFDKMAFADAVKQKNNFMALDKNWTVKAGGRRITTLPDGKFLASFSDGLFVLDSLPNRFRLMWPDGSMIWANSLAGNWMSLSSGGIARLQKVNGLWRAEEKLFGMLKVRFLKESDNTVWMLTEDNQLLRYKLDNKQVTWHFNTSDATDFSVAAMTVTDHHVWLATNRGLLRIRKGAAGMPLKVELTPPSAPLSVAYGGNVELEDRAVALNPWLPWQWTWVAGDSTSIWSPKDGMVLSAGNAGSHTINLNASLLGQYRVDWAASWKTDTPSPLLFWREILATTLMVALLVLLLVAYLLRQRDRQRMQAEVATSQLTALNAQMNPHFVFNLLQSVQGMVYTQSRQQAASTLADYSELVRLYLEQSRALWVKLEDEVRALELYLSLEQTRMSPALSFTIVVDEQLSGGWQIPSMVLQPLVENAIVHGLMHLSQDRQLSITMRLASSNTVLVEVEDNGIGRTAAMQLRANRKHHPFGTQAVESRLRILRQLTGQPLTLTYDDKVGNGTPAGTLVTILLPIQQGKTGAMFQSSAS